MPGNRLEDLLPETVVLEARRELRQERTQLAGSCQRFDAVPEYVDIITGNDCFFPCRLMIHIGVGEFLPEFYCEHEVGRGQLYPVRCITWIRRTVKRAVDLDCF